VAHRVPARLTAAEGRKFGLTLGGAFLALAAISWWRGGLLATRIFGAIGVALIFAGVIAPTALGPVNRAWMGLAERMSKITTPIVMGLLFYLVITPVGLLMRLFGNRPLDHRSPRDSFWIERASGARRSALDRPY
jgi:hypothetical protein